MRLTLVFAATLLLLIALAGCGGKQAQQAETTPATTSAPAATPAAGAPGDTVMPADLDQGPRASESPVDEAKAAAGEKLFQTKGCTVCHAFGKRVIGPDLIGVPRQRTAKWMESQILHPDLMTRQDPIAKQLLATYKTQMTNQGLTPDEAQAVVEYIKKKDKEAGK